MTNYNANPLLPIIPISGSLNLTPLYDINYFTATITNTNYNFTLPPIICDGMKIKIVRNDSDITSSLTIGGSNNIKQAGVTSTTITANIRSVVSFISFNNEWYVYKYLFLDTDGYKSIFSGNFTANNGNSYSIISGGAGQLISVFSYMGSMNIDGGPIKGGAFILTHISGTVNTTLYLSDSTGIPIIATTNNVNVVAGPAIMAQFQIVNQNLLPTGPSSLFLYITVNGSGGNKVGISSFVIY